MKRANRLITNLMACVVSLCAWSQSGDVTKLIINEIQVSNIDQYIDPSFNYGGWMELYNPTDENISLAGLYVAESADNLQQFKLPSSAGTIRAKGYHTIWFDHNRADGNFGSASIRQVRFKLDCDGGTVFLSSSAGTLIASVTYPAGVPRCSYARKSDGADEWGMTDKPTPDASNDGTQFATQRLEAPTVDTDGRILDSGQQLTFSVDIPKGATLRYTTDGSTPGWRNGSTSTTGKFTVSRTTVYRFVLQQDGYLSSPVVTRSFIYRNHDYYLPILSIVTKPANLFDSEIGVYVSGSNGISGNGQGSPKNWNMDWERPVNVEYLIPFDNGEGLEYQSVLNQESDFEIAGGWSRAWGGGTVDGKYWEMKSSFRLKGDKRYEGQKHFDYPIFPHKPYNQYHCLQVRNGGNDSYARTKDANLQMIALTSGFYIDCQDWQPAHVFFNGDYLGMLNIRESNNKHFGYSNYGIDTDDMDQFDLSNAQYNQKVGDDAAWKELLALASDLARNKSAETYREVCARLDIDEYINYMAFECYIGCSDWITNTNNVKGFRSRSDDGKFHFVVFDLDSAWDSDNMISNLIGTSGGANVDDLFRSLIKYEPFKKQFIDAFCLVDGSLFEPGRCSEIITSMYETMNRALGFEGNSSNTDMIRTIRNAHNGSRINNMKNYFGLPSGYKVTLKSNIGEGRLLVNGQEVPTRRFEGYLFEPVTLTAKAPAGYTFAGWMLKGAASDNVQSLIDWGDDWNYYDRGSLDRKDWKSLSYDDASWSSGLAPLGYANSGMPMSSMFNTTLDYGGNTNNKRPTYYFRKKIMLDEQPDDDCVVTLSYKVDDGFRIYVNGVDVGGYRSPQGTVYSDVTGEWAGDVPDEGTFQINPAMLHEGENMIAVEVHNVSLTSSDIFWDCNLSLSRMENSFLSDKETFCLSDAKETGVYQIEAKYERISKERTRYEAGATPIRINEVSAGNDIYISEYRKRNDWVELYNTTDDNIDVAGMYLSDDVHNPQKYCIVASEGVNTVVPAHGTLTVWCDSKEQLTQMHAPFKLDNSDGASVIIQAADGTWADRMTYLAQPRWYTYGRYPDGGDHEALLAQPTIDKANMLGTFDFTQVEDSEWYSSDITITLALAKGWNWVSHNLAESVSRSRFTTYANVIEGQTESLRHEGDAWTGTLESLTPAAGYKVAMTQLADITLRGNLFDPDGEVSVNAGWNWIGFPLYNSTHLETALTNYAAAEGDVIIGLEGIATYEDGTWGGTLTSLEPGQSYLLRTSSPKHFTWNSLARLTERHRRYAAPRRESEEDNPWSPDIHAYPNVMGLIARLEINGEEVTGGRYTLGAFALDGECRGMATFDDGHGCLNIHGEGGETIAFRVMDAEGRTFDVEKTFTFASQDVLGTRRTPQLLTLDASTIEMPTYDSKVIRVEYYSLSGQRLMRPYGICIQRTVYGDGHTASRKIN